MGGGGSVRLPRLIGAARMMDMMLTGRAYSADEGQMIGLSHYLVDTGEGLAHAGWSSRAGSPRTRRSPISPSCTCCRGSPNPTRTSAYLTESLMAAIAQNDEEAKVRLKAFLEKRAPKVAGKS